MERRMRVQSAVVFGFVLGLAACVGRAELVAHWPLNEVSGTVAHDAAGGHDGTVHGGAAWMPFRPDQRGALAFDGRSSYVTAPFVLDPARGPFSVFARVHGTQPGGTIIGQQDEAGAGRVWLGTSAVREGDRPDAYGYLMTGLADGPKGALYSTTVITDDRPHHVGLVWDGQRRYLYVDGDDVARDESNLKGLEGSLGGLIIGADKKLAESGFWAGYLREIRIYDHALSARAVRALASGVDPSSMPEVVVVAPKVLYTGASAALTITTIRADGAPVAAAVLVRLFSPEVSSVVFEGATGRSGRLVARFDTPDVSPGSYSLEVNVDGIESLLVPVQVREMPIVLIETDKPIYKPGQTIQGRVLVLTNELRPTAAEASVQITDGKGVKIFRKDLRTNAFGVAPFTLDLASELNYGTWKITADSGSAHGMVDIRVEEYVLPRFEVKLEMERDYFRVTEEIPGTVRATYFFGKPVDGMLEVRASRYVGVWEEYARYTAPLADGSADFLLPKVGYASGTPGAGGSGSVQLDITVTDTSGHEEKTAKLLKVVSAGIEHTLIAAARSFTPGQPFEIMLIAQTPDGVPVFTTADVQCEYYSQDYRSIRQEKAKVSLEGSTSLVLTAPKDASWASIQSTARSGTESVTAYLSVYATYSPTDSFLHLARSDDKPVQVGQTLSVDVYRTHRTTVFYDVFANGHTVWSDATTGDQISFTVTPQMLPAAKVVAYVINPNNEVSADTVEFRVEMEAATDLNASFSAEEVLPGEPVQVRIDAGTEAMVGLAIVDESVYALNEGRLNMQEVFNELEQRFMEPQAEVHEQAYSYGARDVFNDAGLQVVTSGGLDVPEGHWIWGFWGGGVVRRTPAIAPSPNATDGGETADLAEVTRVRQYFPETWLWMPDLLTDRSGAAGIDLEAPDSITTWRLHAVSTSENGLGIAESSLRVFQEFFGEPDLPYSVTRGERFPVRIQIFNYLAEPQVVHVELAEADWFKLLDIPRQQVQVNANSVGAASFVIEPTRLGRNRLEVTLQSVRRADAVRKEVLVEPQGTKRELVANGMIRAGERLTIDANMPPYIVPDSGKLLLSITPSLVAQSINGLDNLLHMPYGCGEQNMIFFAPDVEVLRYLDATGQLTPEVRAKAEHFITCGYQRELTFRHTDGSFSAFGESDGKSGSLWLTAFVLDCFSGAREVTTIDDAVLSKAATWIASHQLANGSWEPVGFVCHSEMLGGVQGTYALTAFVTIALADYGAAPAQTVQNGIRYLRNNLSTVQNDAYGLAIASLALARTGDPMVNTALDQLMLLAKSDSDGLHWEPHPIETTAYAALAMIEMGRPQANEAVKWIAMQSNSLGGYRSTQDTVLALKALMLAARNQSRNVDLLVTARSATGDVLADFVVNSENFDVLQTAELPIQAGIEVSATGSGEVRLQVVRRFNVLLGDESIQRDMSLEVTYDAEHVEVDDIVNVSVTVRYFGRKDSTGMMIVDVGVPTGFATVNDSLESLVEKRTITKYEVAGRKVILYLDGLTRGEQRSFSFQVKARFPVRAVIPDSSAYSYYEPDIRAEASGTEIAVGTLPDEN